MSKSSNNIIGVFDSGLGGLSVLKYFLKIIPGYHYIYLGDTARVPYGDKSPATIYEYTKEAVEFLFKKNCHLVIIACNTASAQALRRLQQEWLPVNYPKNKILGVIRPLAEAAASESQGKNIGIMGTTATIASNAYQEEIQNINPDLKIIQQSAPLLVPLIEAGELNKPATKIILEEYLKPFKKINTLILACTHYPYLLPQIKKILDASIWIPNTGEIIANSLKDYLNRHQIIKGLKTETEFYTTDATQPFKELAEKFLGQKIIKIQQIKL